MLQGVPPLGGDDLHLRLLRALRHRPCPNQAALLSGHSRLLLQEKNSHLNLVGFLKVPANLTPLSLLITNKES